MYALIDCNNFYVSCERAFQPQLQEKPGVVLSNNDGCAIARSQEAKDRGIPMGAPYFQLKETHKDVWVRSSNYPLYQDMMYRVTSIIRKYFPEQEIYSIDECFCDLATQTKYQDPEQLALHLRAEILKCTGIPVCIGVARTKTLSKIANRIAKKKFKERGVFFISADKEREALEITEIGDVWGIGRQHAKRLIVLGVNNAFQFTQLPIDWVQKQMTIVGVRMWRELRGETCIPMEYVREAKKGIGTSRSFGRPEGEIKEILEAASTYVCIAAQKLRSQNSVAGKIYVYIQTSQFIEKEKQYACGLELKLPTPTANNGELIRIAKWIIRKTFKKGYRYSKVGIMLSDIRPVSQVQLALFDKTSPIRGKISNALSVMDKLNNKFGRDSVRVAASGFERKWTMKQEFLSNRYTTCFRELIVVKAR